jgi:hypothetical protein
VARILNVATSRPWRFERFSSHLAATRSYRGTRRCAVLSRYPPYPKFRGTARRPERWVKAHRRNSRHLTGTREINLLARREIQVRKASKSGSRHGHDRSRLSHQSMERRLCRWSAGPCGIVEPLSFRQRRSDRLARGPGRWADEGALVLDKRRTLRLIGYARS